MPILLFAFSLIGSCFSFGQDSSDSMVISRNSVFIEAGGNAPFVSLNYDYLTQTKKEIIKYAFTFGFTHHFTDPLDFVVAPQYNVLIGRKLMAEIGAGITIPFSYIRNGVLVLRFGARYQKMGGGMMYRLAFTPLLSPLSDQMLLPMFGISIGYSFTCNRNRK